MKQTTVCLPHYTHYASFCFQIWTPLIKDYLSLMQNILDMFNNKNEQVQEKKTRKLNWKIDKQKMHFFLNFLIARLYLFLIYFFWQQAGTQIYQDSSGKLVPFYTINCLWDISNDWEYRVTVGV